MRVAHRHRCNVVNDSRHVASAVAVARVDTLDGRGVSGRGDRAWPTR
jgi:hypothetical protein